MAVKETGKRTSKRRALVRGEPVVRSVLAAALEELARVGYQGMRIEDVAARAAVNKTTVYRRFPTKEELVRAALLSMSSSAMSPPNTGSLRDDLIELALRRVSKMNSSQGQSIMRMMLAEGPDSELMTIVRSLHASHEATPRSVFESAKARGELAEDADVTLLLDVLRAAVRDRVFLKQKRIEKRFLGRLVDLLLYGALRSPPRRRAPPRG